MQFTPQDIKPVMSGGLLSFPVADFDTDGSFNACGHAKRVGHDAGPVHAPLSDLKPDELDQLKAWIDALGPQ